MKYETDLKPVYTAKREYLRRKGYLQIKSNKKGGEKYSNTEELPHTHTKERKLADCDTKDYQRENIDRSYVR